MRLSPRDRVALFIGGGALALYIIIGFGLYPLLDSNTRLRNGIEKRQKAAIEMRTMQEKVRRLSDRSSGLEQQLTHRSQHFSLFSFLEQKATSNGVKKNIASIKPTQQKNDDRFNHLQVELKLQGIGLKQLVNYLEAIESPQNIVALKRVFIQENTKNREKLDVTIQVISVERVNNGGAS